MLSRRWLALLLLLAALFAGLRAVHLLQEPPQASSLVTDQVVVVGVTGRPALTPTDRAVLGPRLADAQVGAVSVRPRHVGDCAAAGWTTLGAGRRAAVGALCDPRVSDGRVEDWDARLTAAAARRGDARPGTLAGSVAGCVAAVGPGAALAAARPDGTLADYRTVEEFLADDLTTRCPTTLVDAGPRSDAVIARLAADPGRTLLVTGVGPAAGSADPALQVVYRLGTTFPGWLTSASTRRDGIVTLTDLTRTLVDHDAPPGAAVPVTVDGSPLAVDPAELSLPLVEDHLAAVAALSDGAVVGYLVLGGFGTLLCLVGLVGTLRRRFAVPRLILTLGSVLGAAMMLTGSVPWAGSGAPGLVLGVAVIGWSLLLAAATLALAARLDVPAAVVGAALTVAAFTVDAALGGPMQAGSMLNSRPVFGLRWYGFGNVTFAVYATAALVLAGWLAHRFLAAGHRRAAVVAVAVVGFGVVVCEGWPTMGTDFGGVVALTPPVLWLLLVVAGVRVTVPRLLAVGAAAVVAVAAISLLDWSRGPDRRSHLGGFVQRVLDGDAVDVVSRKAVASAETVVSGPGITTLVIGVLLWLLVLRCALPVLRPAFPTLPAVLQAALATAVLGTLLNDGGISVWLTVTGMVAVSVGWFCLDHALREGWPSPAPGRELWTWLSRGAARR
ncbi:hypothetical protein SAMN04488543_3976 [Friedmanniella luteola]|uniref:Uncharacterized protein n=1 Tax=Friedmanniella luteola TaxID=546871 RepID=A0A1H1ZSG2_9ACTN|nr:hypothetical protein [Friedmanniella luteola]SDT36648.1 hypothetical protein SAMN04488543_3976 [Friedmanniella luteola]